MANKQIVGWFLITGGVLVILWGLYSSFQIFTGEKNPPEIFKMEKQVASPSATKTKGVDLEAQAQEMISQALQEQLKGVLPAGSIPKSLNLFSWSIFSWILLFGGGQLAWIGVKLLR